MGSVQPWCSYIPSCSVSTSSSSSCSSPRLRSATCLVLGLALQSIDAAEVVPLVVEERPWDEAYRLADEKMAEISPWETSRLVKGIGWHRPFAITPGYYTGNIAGNPSKGIPWLKMQDSGNGFRSMLPAAAGASVVWASPLALASTWDEVIIEEQAIAIGREFRGKEANVMLGPGVNVHRNARGGRNFEYLSGEDPYLGACLSRAFVRGVQSQGVMSVVKHFAFNEQETHRNWVSSEIDDRTAWELYYPPFEAAVEAGAAAFMCPYNKVNGTYACSNWDLLQRDLKGKMRFRGFVMSDWGAIHSTDMAKGTDMDQPGFDGFYNFANVRKHEEALNNSARRVLASMYRLRLDQQPAGCKPPMCFASQSKNVTTADNILLARRAATAAVVLLRNDGILPLDASTIKNIGVLGKAADSRVSKYGMDDPRSPGLPIGDYYSGGGSGHTQGIDDAIVTPLEAISARAKAAGIGVSSANTTFSDRDLKELEEAELFIIVSGSRTVEGVDRLSLDVDDQDLIYQAAKLKPTVVLLTVPGAVLMPWREDVSAIAAIFYGGQEMGHAWASVLFGDATPAAKLPIMMPETEEDVIEPASGFEDKYAEGMATSYRSEALKAAFPFGHGLSYTTFRMGEVNAQVNHEIWLQHVQFSPLPHAPGPPGQMIPESDILVMVEVAVENNGLRPGAEVIQAYLEFPKAPAGTPKLQLRGFRKTRELPSGAREIVRLSFGPRHFSTYSPSQGWQVQDHVILRLGTSSRRLGEALPLTAQSALAPEAFTTHPPVAPVAPAVTAAPSEIVTRAPASLTTPPNQRVEPTPVAGPPPAKQLAPPSDSNNWILWLLQPLLLLLVVLIAWLCTRGVAVEEGDDDKDLFENELPSILRDAELFNPADHSPEDGVMSPLVGDGEPRLGPL